MSDLPQGKRSINSEGVPNSSSKVQRITEDDGCVGSASANRCSNRLDSGELCDSMNIDKTLFDKFGATICSHCRVNYSDRFRFITQTEVLTKHLLSVKHISHLKYVLKENPMNRHYTSMKLFLKSQVDEVVITVWKSEELLMQEITKRQDAKFRLELEKVEAQVGSGSATSTPAGTSTMNSSGSNGKLKKQQRIKNKNKFLADAISSITGKKGDV